MMALEAQQISICQQYGAVAFATPASLKVGISQSALDGVLPLNGLRYQPIGNTSGWYIWGGEELSEEDEFFMPMHIYHLYDQFPSVIKYLLLPPAWRFLTDTEEFVDVWVDEELLGVR